MIIKKNNGAVVFYSSSNRRNGLAKELEKVFREYRRKVFREYRRKVVLSYLYNKIKNWIPKLLRTPFCKHRYMIIYRVESIDNTGYGAGGTLLYYRRCNDCIKQDCITHRIIPEYTSGLRKRIKTVFSSSTPGRTRQEQKIEWI